MCLHFAVFSHKRPFVYHECWKYPDILYPAIVVQRARISQTVFRSLYVSYPILVGPEKEKSIFVNFQSDWNADSRILQLHSIVLVWSTRGNEMEGPLLLCLLNRATV